jgi:hypothetical protein
MQRRHSCLRFFWIGIDTSFPRLYWLERPSGFSKFVSVPKKVLIRFIQYL